MRAQDLYTGLELVISLALDVVVDILNVLVDYIMQLIIVK